MRPALLPMTETVDSDEDFQQDLIHLNAMQGQDSSILFPCIINGVFGKVLMDTGANRNFMSYRYWAKVFGKDKDVSKQKQRVKTVLLLNGQTMAIYGIYDMNVEISEWHGRIQVCVADLQSEFDVVLGLNWHRQYQPKIDWNMMVFEVQEGGRVYKLMPVPQDLDQTIEMSSLCLNTMTVR